MAYKYKELALSIDNVKQILKTLPISFYLGKNNLEVSLDDKIPTSCINTGYTNILIAYNNIKDACKNTGKAKETTIRGLLYHEVSHAMYTPSSLFNTFKRYSILYSKTYGNFEINVFEDERIETLNKNLFYGVDFKKNVWDILNYNPNPKTAEEYYFNVVRFRKTQGHAELITDMLGIINDYSSLTSMDTEDERNYCSEVVRFVAKVYDTFNAMKAEQESKDGKGKNSEETSETNNENENETNNENTESQESQENQGDETPADDADNETEDGQENSEDESDETDEDDEEETDEENGENAEEEQADTTEEAEKIESEIESTSKERLEKVACRLKECSLMAEGKMAGLSMYPAKQGLKAKIMRIIAKNRGFGIQEHETEEGYSGDFNPELKMLDFEGSKKWWSDESDEGEKNNTSAKVVLNIWLDNSGSYQLNDYATNVLLKSLSLLEKERKDFTFNLVTFNTAFTLKTGDDRVSISTGGNALPKAQIVPLYKKLNPTGNEYNIMLFDGSAGYTDYEARLFGYSKDFVSYSNLYQFNNRRTTFITEESNEDGLKDACPKANLIVENSNYTEKLEENVLKALEMLF